MVLNAGLKATTIVFLMIVITICFYKLLPEPSAEAYGRYAGNNECYQTFDCKNLQNSCYQYIHEGNDELIYANCINTFRRSSEFKECDFALKNCNEDLFKQSITYRHSRVVFFIFVIIGSVLIAIGVMRKKKRFGDVLVAAGAGAIILASLFSIYFLYGLSQYFKIASLCVLAGTVFYYLFRKKGRSIFKTSFFWLFILFLLFFFLIFIYLVPDAITFSLFISNDPTVEGNFFYRMILSTAMIFISVLFIFFVRSYFNLLTD